MLISYSRLVVLPTGEVYPSDFEVEEDEASPDWVMCGQLTLSSPGCFWGDFFPAHVAGLMVRTIEETVPRSEPERHLLSLSDGWGPTTTEGGP